MSVVVHVVVVIVEAAESGVGEVEFELVADSVSAPTDVIHLDGLAFVARLTVRYCKSIALFFVLFRGLRAVFIKIITIRIFSCLNLLTKFEQIINDVF